MGFQTNIKSGKTRFEVDENPQHNFTYEECKMWVLMPIFNPRTFKSILIDSPLYNRLLCMSYQYDTNLIPRMLTSDGISLILALYETIIKTLKTLKERPQTLEELKDYNIHMIRMVKWKLVGKNQPKKGTELVITKRLINTLSKNPTFYIYMNNDDLPGEIAKDSYIKITDSNGIAYYYTIVMERSADRSEVINKPIVIRQRSDYTFVYTIDECIEWSKIPNINPVTKDEIEQDSPEYNMIFEQSLRFNTNILPINISQDGIKYKF
jgi:hypothetical protein